MGSAHLLPHAPQFATSVSRFTSQPSFAFLLQSANGAVHAPIPHVPMAQPGAPLATAAHTLPQAPQLATSLAEFTSQPSALFMLQSLNAPVQALTPHTPAAQPGVPLAGAGHIMPHAPQLPG